MNTLAIIDGDSLCYICSKDTIEVSIATLDSMIEEILEKTGSTHYYLFLSRGPYYRHNINKEYKGKRSKSPLLFVKTLNTYLREQYFGESYPKLEADDLVSYVQNKFNTAGIKDIDQTIVCAIDKDVVGQVPCRYYNYRTYKFGLTVKKEAEYFLHLQSIMGDSTDNIKGIPGTGLAKATKLLDAAEPIHYANVAYDAYRAHYKEAGTALFEYQKNFRQVYMLKTDEDFIAEVGYIPELNNPIEIYT